MTSGAPYFLVLSSYQLLLWLDLTNIIKEILIKEILIKEILIKEILIKEIFLIKEILDPI